MQKPILILIYLLFLTSWAIAQPATHTVRAGETLFSISRQYEVTVQQIRQWNQLPDNSIRIGQRLYLADPGPDLAQRTSQEKVPPDTLVHIVEPGQTLFRISRMYDVPLEIIISANNLENHALAIGQTLTIITGITPGDENHLMSAETTTSGTAARMDEISYPAATPEEAVFGTDMETGYHVVRPGDTLFRIATRNSMTVDELMEANQLDHAGLEVGQRLRVRTRSVAPPSVSAEWDMESSPQGRFVRYTISGEDSVEDLLAYHGMDRIEYRALNPGMPYSELRPGDEITLLLPVTHSHRNPYLVRSADLEQSTIRASRYDAQQRGTTTTSGDLYNPEALTAAHPVLTLGSVVFVTNPENGRGVHVLINDRVTGNRIMLSDAACKALGITQGSEVMVSIVHETARAAR